MNDTINIHVPHVDVIKLKLGQLKTEYLHPNSKEKLPGVRHEWSNDELDVAALVIGNKLVDAFSLNMPAQHRFQHMARYIFQHGYLRAQADVRRAIGVDQ